MKRFVFVTIAAALAGTTLARAATTRPAVLAGAYYFDGWTGSTDHLRPRLKEEFFDREPVWGWNDASPHVMRQQIDFAADNAIGFFAFDWYWPEEKKKQTPLNTGLELYLKAPNLDRIGFCLMVANHGGFRIGPKDWDAVSRIWIDLFKQPTHVRVDGKPLLIFFSPRDLVEQFGDAAKIRIAFDALQKQAKEAGLEGVSIAACCAPGPENGWIDLEMLKSAGFTCFTGYNYHGYPMKGKEKIQAFATMVGGHEELWNRFARKNVLPYMPCVTVGWDKRPWEEPGLPEAQRSAYYPDRTPPQVAEFISRAIAWLDANPDKTPRERIVLIYAWNENGEGGYLTPTKSTGDIYLRAVGNALRGKNNPRQAGG